MSAVAAITALTCDFSLERVTGIEPALSAWEADVLPLNYTRAVPGPNQPVARPDIVPDAFQQSGEGGDYLWA